MGWKVKGLYDNNDILNYGFSELKNIMSTFQTLHLPFELFVDRLLIKIM